MKMTVRWTENVRVGQLGLCALMGLTLWIGGCGGGEKITISYDRPAKYDVPANVKKVAVVQFGAKSDTEEKWGEIASDKLSYALDQYNKKFGRYVLIERKRISALMDERDFQRSIAETDQAVQFGKIAKVDAMIYGTVYTTHKSVPQTKKYFDPISQTMQTKNYESLYALAEVNFTMVDVQTATQICTVAVTREYDSEKQKKSWTSSLGFGDNTREASDHVINILIEQCIQAFVMEISPHQIVVEIELEGGKDKLVKMGNSFALEKEYNDAIGKYQAGLAQKPDDDGAMFNTAVCYEALGQFETSAEWYDKAIRYCDNAKRSRKYIAGRRRVRLEEQNDDTPATIQKKKKN